MKRIAVRWPALLVAAAFAGHAVPGSGAESGQWSYSGPNGPARWGKLEKDFATCASGQMQAPIDIPDAHVRKGDLPPLLFNYKPSPLSIVDDGHTIEVSIAPDSWLTVEGRRYQLVSIEFHKPSEIKVSGKAYDMAAHFLHKDKDGHVAILAVPLAQGKENPLVKTLWTYLPLGKGKPNVVATVKINATGLLPSNKDYYAFAGSLSAPPCTENVQWYVLKTPETVSPEQIARFAKLYPMNARPVQPLNDRDIIGSP